jgi:hypothetical protein
VRVVVEGVADGEVPLDGHSDREVDGPRGTDLSQRQGPGVDFMNQYRPKFTDKNLYTYIAFNT